MYECSETEHDAQNDGILDRIQDEREEWIIDGAMGAQLRCPGYMKHSLQ